MADWLQSAIEQVKGAALPFRDKAGAIEYYQQEYPRMGRGGWKQHLVQGLSEVTGLKPKNLEKRFDTQRRGNPERKNAKQYKALAQSLDVLVAPKKGFHVHYEGGILFSECEWREFDVDITGALADEVVADPSQVVDIAIKVYMQQEEEDESNGPCDELGEPKVTVTANANDYNAPAVKRHKPAVPFFKRK